MVYGMSHQCGYPVVKCSSSLSIYIRFWNHEIFKVEKWFDSKQPATIFSLREKKQYRCWVHSTRERFIKGKQIVSLVQFSASCRIGCLLGEIQQPGRCYTFMSKCALRTAAQSTNKHSHTNIWQHGSHLQFQTCSGIILCIFFYLHKIYWLNYWHTSCK